MTHPYWPPNAARAYTDAEGKTYSEMYDAIVAFLTSPDVPEPIRDGIVYAVRAVSTRTVDPDTPYETPDPDDEAAQPSTRAVFLREAAAALVAEVGPNGLRTGSQVEAWLNRYARDHG